jgi:transposase, IS30 family
MKKCKRTYNQLTLVDRERIGIYVVMGKSARDIAKILGRSHTTISREIRRNNKAVPMMVGYVGCKAHEATKERKSGARRPRLKDPRVSGYVKEHLKLGWSPEQIANTVPQCIPGIKVSHEAIYQYIYTDYREGIGYLARRHKQRYRKTYSRKRQTSVIPNRISIGQRPVKVNQRKIFGHWEADSIVSSHSAAAINVLLERKSRLVKLRYLEATKAYLTCDAICSSLAPLPSKARLSITYDNGFENSKHELTNAILQTESYFCEPYHSWEKGSIENANGLIRRFIPKKTDLSKITQDQLNYIEFLLNNRPRKCLKYKTPAEVFLKFSGALHP